MYFTPHSSAWDSSFRLKLSCRIWLATLAANPFLNECCEPTAMAAVSRLPNSDFSICCAECRSTTCPVSWRSTPSCNERHHFRSLQNQPGQTDWRPYVRQFAHSYRTTDPHGRSDSTNCNSATIESTLLGARSATSSSEGLCTVVTVFRQVHGCKSSNPLGRLKRSCQ